MRDYAFKNRLTGQRVLVASMATSDLQRWLAADRPVSDSRGRSVSPAAFLERVLLEMFIRENNLRG